MKKLLMAACALVACTQISKAQSLYWDRNGTDPGTGTTAAATWDGILANWNPLADGTGTTELWTPGATAVFSAGTDATGSQAIAISGTQSVGRVVVEEGIVTFSGGSLDLTGDATFDVTSTNILSNTTVLSGSAGLTKEGPGELRIGSAANNYTGNTTVKAGTLTATTATFQLGSSTASELILDGGNVRAQLSTTIANPIHLKQNAEIFGDAASGTRTLTLTSGTLVNTAGTLKFRHKGAAAGVFSVRLRTGGITIDSPIQIGEVGDVGTIIVRADNVDNLVQTINGQISGPGIFERNLNSEVYGNTTILNGDNTYSGGTHLKGGFIGLGHDNALGTGVLGIGYDNAHEGLFAHGAARTLTNDISFNLSTSATNLHIGGEHDLTLTGNVTLHPTTARPVSLTISNTGLTTLSGVISGGAGLGLRKLGDETLVLSGANTYAGDTFILAGTLRVANSTGSATSSGAVSVDAGATLEGNGSVSGAVALNGTVSPGTSVGTLNSGSQTWNGGASYNFEVNDAITTPGTGWDLINITGGLDITATTENKFNINVASLVGSAAGPAANFSSASSYNWTIVTTTTGITGFDAANINLDVTGFQNSLDGGFFTLATANGGLDLVLTFNVAPAAPVILTEADDVTVASGGNAQFAVSVTGDEPMTFVWKLNDVALVNGGVVSGADTATLNLTGVTQVDAGSYTVAITNGAGGIVSAPATLTVIDPPVITTELVSQEVSAGTEVTLLVTVSGTAPFDYVWTKNGVTIDGEVGSKIELVASSADVGTYVVTVTNLAGSDSSSATLIVNEAPAITTQPADLSVSSGEAAVFTVVATGYPLNYQWSFNGSAILDATNSSYTVSAAAPADIGYYSVVVSNGLGSETSTDASLSIAQVLFADDFDTDTTANWAVNKSGNPTGNHAEISFDYSTVGVPPAPHAVGSTQKGLRLRANVSGATFGGLSVSPIGQSFTGDYELRFDLWQNFNGPLSVGGSGSTQVTGAGIGTAGTTAQWAGGAHDAIHFGATGEGGSAQDWRVYPKAGIATPASGMYAAGTGTSPDARNNTHPYYAGFGGKTAPAEQLALFPGQTGTSAVGTAGFQWHDVVIKKSGNVVTWTVNETLIATVNAGAITLGGNNILLNHYDVNGTISSESAAAHMLFGLFDNVRVQGVVAPVITTQPATHSVAAGNTATLTVAATSSTPLRYQWRKNGVDISGATDATLTIENSVVSDSGDYSVLVLNDSAPVTSDTATLTVIEVTAPANVQISVSPNATVNEGVSVTLSFVSADGTAPFDYQWFKGGFAITDATDSTYTIASAQTTDAGEYHLEVSNLADSAISSTITLAVTADETLPVLKVLAPKVNFPYTSSSLVMTGTVLDAVGVASVQYTLNGSSSSAQVSFVGNGKASNWVASVTLSPGTNEVTVTASDLAGNAVSVGPIKFYYHTASPLTVVKTLNGDTDLGTNHVGTVVNTIPSSLFSGNNTNLFVGRTYTLKVIEDGLPKFGFILTNWTATWVGQASPVVVQTNSLICTFEMKEGMVLKANFISNPFYRFGGTYLGLFSDTNGVAFHSAGYAQIKVTPKMTFSAKLLVDGNPVAIAGKLKIDGTGSATSKARVKVTDKPELTVDLALDFAGGTESLSGTVSEGETWSSELLAYRNVWSKTNVLEQAQAFTNNYTMQVPGFATISEGPVGTASGGLKVDVRGKVVLTGVGSDMHLMKQATWISEEGHWPFFSPMYKVKRTNALSKLITETRGFAMGWLQFTTNGLGNLRPEGEVHTIKTTWVNDLFTPGWTNSVYQGGFTNAADVVASRWAYDALAPQNALPIAGVVIDFLEGDLGSAFSGEWAVTVKSTFAPIKGNVYPNTVKAALVPKTGVFKGTFIHPSNAALTKYQGVLLQDGGSGAGTFIGPVNGGKVTVSEAPVGP